MYCSIVPAGFFTPGCGPGGLGLDVRPWPFATSKWRPSGVTRTEVGYHPTGMNPSGRARPSRLTSNTATSLLQALATNRVFSSGVRARLLGVEPGGDFG